MNADRPPIFNVRAGERGLVLLLLALLATNTLVLEISEVVALSRFLENVGTAQVPWLWIVDMLIILMATAGYAIMADRVSRVTLVSWLLGGFALLYLAILLLLGAGAYDWVVYPLLYILADLQFIIFPLAFWALANDLYTVAETQRLFPIIAAGGTVGRISGNALAAASTAFFAPQQGGLTYLLLTGVLVYLPALLVLRRAFRHRPLRARQATGQSFDIRANFQVGADFFRNVPIFRYLALAMLLVGLALTIVEFHFLVVVGAEFEGQPGQFQQFYGIYKLALIVATLLCQSLVTSRLLGKAEVKRSFVVLPITMAGAAAAGLVLPGLVGGAGGRFAARLVEWSWDEPARRSLQGLIPDERRGRVASFIDSYFYAVATIAGCLLLVALSSVGAIPAGLRPLAYLLVAELAALAAVWAALRLRAVYEVSLLNWRLARPRRKSILDKIEI